MSLIWYTKSKMGDQISHLGNDNYDRLRFISELINNYPVEDLTFYNEDELNEKEKQSAIWIPDKFRNLYKSEYIINPVLTYDEMWRIINEYRYKGGQ